MNAHTLLEPVLRDILLSIQPTRDDWTAREHAIGELRVFVRLVENLKGVTVEPFGSFVSNLFTQSGDLDISLFSNSSYATTAGKRRAQKLLQYLYAALRKTSRWSQLHFIHNARIPIIKCVNHQNISCDISVDNLKGLLKSKCLFWISGIDARFCELVLLVKEWAKTHDINNSKIGTLNSYSYCLLIIFHFQTCVPAILPPLEEIYPANMVDELPGIRDVVERRIKEICASNISRFKSDLPRPVNKSSLSELFVSFLAKFSDIDSRASNLAICPFTGTWEYKITLMRSQTKNYPLFIQDPFEQPENSARAVSSEHLTRISEVFASTHRELVAANLNRSCIITAVCRPQTTMANGRQQHQSSRISGVGHSMPRPPSSSHVQPVQSAPTQLCHQFQNVPSTVTEPRGGQRLSRPVCSQSQWAWRPKEK